jgi:hypothetical protein
MNAPDTIYEQLQAILASAPPLYPEVFSCWEGHEEPDDRRRARIALGSIAILPGHNLASAWALTEVLRGFEWRAVTETIWVCDTCGASFSDGHDRRPPDTAHHARGCWMGGFLGRVLVGPVAP